MYSTVIIPFGFYTSHSLSVREKPHNHYWALKSFVKGTPKNGIAIDIFKLRQLTDPYVEKPADTYLNENPILTKEQTACPTCKMLATHFYTHISQATEASDANAELKAVEVELRELEEKEWATARLEVD